MSCFINSILLLLVAIASSCYGNRQMSVEINPNCTEENSCKAKADVVYVRAVGQADTVHYLWNTVSMLLARTSNDAQLSIDWKSFGTENSSNSVTFSEQPYETSAAILTRLYEYDDVNDVVDISKIDNDHISTHPMYSNLSWMPFSISSASDFAQAKVNASNGTVLISLNAYGSEGHPSKLPSLLYTSESFELELVLDNYPTIYNRTRFAVEWALFDSYAVDDASFHLNKKETIDDEYTPGVFITYTMKSTNSPSNGSSFLQWKPVCYTSSDRTTADSTNSWQDLNTSFSLSHRSEELKSSLAYAYFGSNLTGMLNGWVNISFGLQNDKFYQKDNYLSWTVVIGIGDPPIERFSSLVIVVITVGFGLPALLILIGGVIIIVRRCRKKDDDLNLSNAKLFEEES